MPIFLGRGELIVAPTHVQYMHRGCVVTMARQSPLSLVSRETRQKLSATDNGTEFAAEFAHMLARLGVEHIHTSVAHPLHLL